MKKKVVILLVTGLMLISCVKNPVKTADTSRTSNQSRDGTETSEPASTEVLEYMSNTAEYGKISATVKSSSIDFDTGDVRFSIAFNTADCISDSKGSRTMSKSGKSSVTDKNPSHVKTESVIGKKKIATDYEISDSIVTYTQHGESDSGISAVGVTFTFSDSYSVILPFQNGIRLSKAHPNSSSGLSLTQNYQFGLQMQMFIIEGKEGGAVIYCDDNFTQFKQLSASHSTNKFRVIAETVPQAPFTGYKSFDAASWKIVPYKGDWTSASAIYRDFVTEKFGLNDADKKRPDWVEDIQFYYGCNVLDKNEMSALAKRLDPSKVLIHVADWRTNLYDVNWPDLTPRDNIKELIEYAHSLGFKVQLHCNMFGFELTLNDYKKFSKYHSRDCFSGNPINQDFSDAARHYCFASINPASSEWRKYIINKLVDVVKETGCDALHLDQSLISYNDYNGYIDGMTSLQGTVQYLKELCDALPDNVAIGGEGITDFNATYSSFLQSHPYGIDSSKQTVDSQALDQIVPLTESVYCNVKGAYWPGTPVTNRVDYYLGWFITGALCGHMPTVWRESPSSISNGTDAMEFVLAVGDFLQKNDAKRVYSDWDSKTVQRWYLKNGRYARLIKNSSEYYLYADEEVASSLIAAVAHGTTEIKTDCAINSWIAHSDKSVFGLNPDEFYILLKNGSFSKDFRITSLTSKASISSFSKQGSYYTLSFAEPSGKDIELKFTCSEKITDVYSKSGACVFMDNGDSYSLKIPSGETAYLLFGSSSANLPINLFSLPKTTYYIRDDKSTVTDTTKTSSGSFGGKLSKKITVSVPVKTETILEYAVSLPDTEGIILELSTGTQDSLFKDFPVSVTVNGETVWNGRVREKDIATEISVDISAYRGKTVIISFIADGSKLDSSTHKIIWANPTVKAK